MTTVHAAVTSIAVGKYVGAVQGAMVATGNDLEVVRRKTIEAGKQEAAARRWPRTITIYHVDERRAKKVEGWMVSMGGKVTKRGKQGRPIRLGA